MFAACYELSQLMTLNQPTPQAERLVSKFEELGAVTGDLGLSAVALAKFEDSDGTQCGAYTDSAMASRTISADAKRVGTVCISNPVLKTLRWYEPKEAIHCLSKPCCSSL